MTDTPSGVFCASATPLDENLDPDPARLAAHCRSLLDNGCHGVSLLGSTGEANSLSTSERMALLEAVVASGIAPEQLLPGTGVSAYTETAALTRHALSLGITTVLMLPPFYYKQVPDQGLVDAYSRIIEAVADSRLRVVLYHIPPIAQVPIPHEVIAALIERYPRIIAGVKDSSGDLEHMKGLIAAFPKLSILAGADNFMLELLGLGGGGCITAASNLVSSSLRTIYDHHGDPQRATEVEAAQQRVVACRALIGRYQPQIPTIKAMIGLRLGDAGWARTRPPLVALPDDRMQALKAEFAALEAAE